MTPPKSKTARPRKATKPQRTPSRAKRIAVDLPPPVHTLVKSLAQNNRYTIIAQIEVWAKQEQKEQVHDGRADQFSINK